MGLVDEFVENSADAANTSRVVRGTNLGEFSVDLARIFGTSSSVASEIEHAHRVDSS